MAAGLAGSWAAPFPVRFEEDGAGGVAAADGSMRMAIGKEGRVCLTSGDCAISGKLSFDGERLIWDSGAVWAKQVVADKGAELLIAESQPNLLSDAQIELVADRVNEAVDIWGLPEKIEGEIFRGLAREVNAKLRLCLQRCMSEDWLAALEALLDDSDAPDKVGDKVERIKGAIGRQIADPLTASLNDQIDIPVIGEGAEARLFRAVVDKVLDAIVCKAVRGMERALE